MTDDDKRSLSVASLHEFDDALRVASELSERWEQRLTLNNLALAKRYLKGELIICLAFAVSRGSGDLEYGRAVLKRVHTVGGSDVDAREDDWFILPRDRHRDMHRKVSVSGPYRNDRLVFVQDIEVMDCPEGLIPTLVWLEPLDQPSRACIGSVYFSRKMATVVLSLVEYGKAMIAHDRVGSAGGANSVAKGEVQPSSDVVNDIADYGAEMRRNLFADVDDEELIAGFRVIVGDDFVWASFVERPNFSLKFIDVAFGPFDL